MNVATIGLSPQPEFDDEVDRERCDATQPVLPAIRQGRISGSDEPESADASPRFGSIAGPTSRPFIPSEVRPRKPRGPLNDDQRELTRALSAAGAGPGRRTARSWPAGTDEFESAAFLALVEAAQAFDPSRNVDFATYARHRIRGALLDVQRELFAGGRRGQPECVPRFQPLEADSEVRGRVVGVQVEEPVGAELETADAVEHWLNKLSSRHATAFRHLYLDGKSLEEAAALAGCSKAAMSRMHRETLTWLHQSAGRSTAATKPEAKRRTGPIATVSANRRDRILACGRRGRTRRPSRTPFSASRAEAGRIDSIRRPGSR